MSARLSQSSLRPHSRVRLNVETLESRITPALAAGKWTGLLHEPGLPAYPLYKIKFELTQVGNDVTGTEHLEVSGKPQYYSDRVVYGTATEASVTLHDGASTAEFPPPGVLWIDNKVMTFPLPLAVPSGVVEGDWSGSGFSGALDMKHVSGPKEPAPTFTITVPSSQTDFFITAEPKMPTVAVTASAVSFLGEVIDLSNVKIRWAANLLFTGAETAHGKANKPLAISRTTVGPNFTINSADWLKLRGGDLTLSASATLMGQADTAQLSGLAIKGTNPDIADMRAALGTDVMRQIAHQESNFSQFGNDGWPLFSADNKGGAGIMQITPATEEQQWNWRANIQAGLLKYQQSFHLAAVYYQSLQRSAAFKKLVKATNKDRVANGLIPLTISLPAFTADQQMRDAIRGYNGWAGQDPISKGLRLHEFRAALETNGLLKIQLTSSALDAIAVWEVVPPANRPAVGNPDYVEQVLAQTP